jgi:hypothetical protein
MLNRIAESRIHSGELPKKRPNMSKANGPTAKSGTALSGAALENALANRSFDPPKSQLVGMVKSSAKSGHIGFAQAGCDNWVDLPSSLIAEAHQIGHQFCDDHSHPLFRLVLGEPEDAVAKALIGLLTERTPTSVMSMLTDPGMGGGPEGFQAAPLNARQRQCHSWCVGSTLVCACPVYVPGLGMAYVIYACGTCIRDPVFTA